MTANHNNNHRGSDDDECMGARASMMAARVSGRKQRN
jgi:hypothetical protein